MKKGLMILVATLVAVAVAMPAVAAVEFQYGGVFRTRWITSSNVSDGSSQWQDNDNHFDTRLRLYLTFKASENLKVVWRAEIGNIHWGDSRNATGSNSGGRMGADGVNVKTKNLYVQFNIPNIPTTAVVGVQGINLLQSWLVDDDFSAMAFVTKLDPVTVTLAYISGQNLPFSNVYDSGTGGYSQTAGSYYSSTKDNVDDYAFDITYSQKGVPIKASLTGVFMNANMVPWAIYPEAMQTPASAFYPALSTTTFNDFPSTTFYTPGLTWGNVPWFGNRLDSVKNNQMFDLGFNLSYKIDWLSAYVNFAKNIGSVKTATRQYLGTDTAGGNYYGVYTGGNLLGAGIGQVQDADYTGWMIDAGASYFCGPYTFNLGGFYTSGQNLERQRVVIANNGVQAGNVYNEYGQLVSTNGTYETKRYSSYDNVDFFTYPGATSKVFSEIVGGGILDMYAPFASAQSNGSNFWRGYGFPTNLWTVTAGAAWQVLEKTKLSASYWYFQTSEAVGTGRFERDLSEKTSTDLGHEFNLYLTQGIVDGLTLDIVGAFMLTGDAYARSGYLQATRLGATNNVIVTPVTWDKDNVYEVGARLQWEF